MPRQVPSFLVLLLVVLVWAGAARADEDFRIADVPVDATAATVGQAREQALAEGQRIAYRRLMERLMPDPARIPRLADRDIAALVEGFEVQQERASAIRYIATLAFTFRPDPVRALLRGGTGPGTGVADGDGAMTVRVPLKDVRTWVEVRRRLAGAGIVESARVRAISRTEALLDLGFVGDSNRLRQVLAQRELALSGSSGDWTLRFTGTLPPLPAPVPPPAPGAPAVPGAPAAPAASGL